MSKRYLIIHGHFYQPPRENPWTSAIEPQESAAPFANWNQRINRECYAPNCRSRLLGDGGSIKKLINNYRRLSFNFGPTLLSWMEKADPDTYAQIISADREAAAARDGHGPALAQVYNHIIMPLANTHDRLTQIRWGRTDFETRFGRRPEGMWLAETAADLATLKMLAQEGFKFTILSQGQAAAVRPLTARGTPFPGPPGEAAGWDDVSGGRIDPREPYRVFWGPNPADYLDVFFYDGPVSRSIAFEKLLMDGGNFLRRLEQAFGQPKADGSPRLLNLATDGESYGHHFMFGDMALAWLFNHLEESAGQPEAIELTNYGHYLALFPPVKEVKIFDNTAWSCAHGVERWRSDCGCNTGGGGGAWNQKWRTPLRDGLNWLRDQLAEVFQNRGGQYLKDPWLARNDYIRVMTADYQKNTRQNFLAAHQIRPLTGEEAGEVWSLLESQVMSLYSFTSCGWFFDDISGLEPVQNLRYALRAVELAQPWAKTDLTPGLLRYLEAIRPNVSEYASGLDIWSRLVEPDRLGGRALTAHWAAAAILDVPGVLNFFSTPLFQAHSVAHVQGEGLDILAGVVDLTHRTLDRTERYHCLALYSGGTHLAVLVDEAGDSDADAEPPGWMKEEKLTELLGPRLQAAAALNIWDAMAGLMPRGVRFVMEDLLPCCRRLLLATLARGIFDDIRNHAREHFYLNQHLLMMTRSSGQSITWMERFLFRVIGEAELKRLLAPADFNRPVNMVALANLLSKRGLLGLAKDEPILPGLGEVFLRQVFGTLAVTNAPQRLLEEIISFVKLITDEGYHLELWESQNRWSDLWDDRAWMDRLTPKEKDLMSRLGQALGFSPDLGHRC